MKAVPAEIVGAKLGLTVNDVLEAIAVIALVCPLAVSTSPTCSSVVNTVPLPVTVEPEELIVPVPVRGSPAGTV